MIKYFKELFSEKGTASVARFCVFMCYLTANVISIYSVCFKAEAVGLVATLLSAGTILKVGQKALEKNVE
jgi:hypothetical protein